MTKARNHTDDLRGASRLAVEATRGVTELVQAMHLTIASGPDLLGRPLETPARMVTGLVYAGIRGVTQAVGAGIDLALAQLAPLLGGSRPGPEREAVLAVLNGVLGDYLVESGNPLALQMELRSGGHALPSEKATLPGGRKLLVLIHGSCMSAGQWRRHEHDHGARLAADLGYTPIYVQYNSGLHVSTNGRALAERLEALVTAWPDPLDELAILGFSMGGLVARAACHVGEAEGHHWRRELRKLVFLGTPHHGAPLERGGNWLHGLFGVSRYSAPLGRLGRIRSAGVTDLRFGNVLDEDWQGRDRFTHPTDERTRLPLPEGVECWALAATAGQSPGKKLPSDGLVPVDSALGRHARPELTLDFPESHRSIAYGLGHLDLLDRAEVYATVRGWLAP